MEEFFRNVSRYPKFLISFSLGVVLTLLSPLTRLLNNRTSAVAVVALFVSALAFVALTLRAMLGLEAVS
jgi:heme/copper-type cytochrome/quinol oxidase subunit 4